MTEAELEALIARHPVEGTPRKMREAFAALAAEAPADLSNLKGTEEAFGSVRCLTVAPETGFARTIVHLHGGGYVFGSPETHLGLAAELARAAKARVVLPAYRLAPEHPWPAQREDALAVLAAISGPYVLSGDSAGGHLAIMACAGGARPDRLLLFSPNTTRDYRLSGTRDQDADAMNDHETDDRLARLAFGEVRPLDGEQTVTAETVLALPPSYVEAGTREVLLGDALYLTGFLARTGGSVDLHVRSGFHLIQLFAGRYGPGAESLKRAARWLREER